MERMKNIVAMCINGVTHHDVVEPKTILKKLWLTPRIVMPAAAIAGAQGTQLSTQQPNAQFTGASRKHTRFF